ncbi:uncharacterized protein LOC6529269 [Drosophila yakuba]|uniref:Uncharacterized protein n=1 Tax=Drosophila yakuba TaxID=7245 RepID=B4P717_DROYA|nr:uncharacterized protein LOC6529269 [Drosophila yakuba]XP_039501121.2 uncharacterized protein LOC120457691 [Drosophila santomea]EDW89986.1 uncharacterized protein Dyak_GE12888 [Drosophila yakuba]
MAMMAALSSLFLLVTLASSARAITCYECDSVNNPGCGERFAGDDISTTDCDVVANMRSLGAEATCLTKYHEGMPGDTRFVRRSCYFGDASPIGISCDDGPDPVVPFMNFLGCTLCNTDLCNTAATLSTLPLVSALSLLGLLILLANV